MPTETFEVATKVVTDKTYTVEGWEDVIKLTQPGTVVTLCAASAVTAGQPILFVDEIVERGSPYDVEAGTSHTLTRAGSDTIDGTNTSLYFQGSLRLYSDASTKWYSDRYKLRPDADVTAGNATYTTAVIAPLVQAGANATAGTVRIYPVGGAKGYVDITTTNHSTSNSVTINVGAQAGLRVLSVPATTENSSFVMTSGNAALSDVYVISTGTTTGLKIATATNQKLGFYGATPVDQAANNEDLKDVLIALGLIATGGPTNLDLDGGTLVAGNVTAGTLASAPTVQAGSNGAAGTVTVYPVAANSGYATITVSNSAGHTVTALYVDNQAGARLYTVPDAGVENASFILTYGVSTLGDGKNFVLDTTNGTQIGTAANQKLGLFGAVPIVQCATANAAMTGNTSIAGTAMNQADTFNGGLGNAAYHISDVIYALKTIGILATNAA